jgi:hypothetical protein
VGQRSPWELGAPPPAIVICANPYTAWLPTSGGNRRSRVEVAISHLATSCPSGPVPSGNEKRLPMDGVFGSLAIYVGRAVAPTSRPIALRRHLAVGLPLSEPGAVGTLRWYVRDSAGQME